MQHEKIRQFKRQDVSLRGILRVHEDDRAQVRFSKTLENASNGKKLSVTVIDIGYGGLGLETDVFIPRQARFEIVVYKKMSDDSGESAEEILLSESVTAKRCSMTSRDPLYFVGMGFNSVSIDLKAHLDEFIKSGPNEDPTCSDGSGKGVSLTDRGDCDDA